MAWTLLMHFRMKLQLTRSKTIEVRMPWEKTASAGGASPSGEGVDDVVGVVIGEGDARGCPAVRLQRRKDGIHVVAVGYVPSPGELPESWEQKGRVGEWTLPPAFQSPQAALAVVSAKGFARQTTLDALDSEPDSARNAAESTPNRKRLGVRRNAEEGAVTVPKPAASENAPPKPLVPVSRQGMRFVVAPFAEEPFVLQSGLPEFQALWLAGLLPEGRRPTAGSVQMAPTAVLSAVRELSAFREAAGTAVVVFVLRKSIWFAAYREGELILFRECPGAIGTDVMHELVKTLLGVEDSEVDVFLEEGLVDPTPALEPLMRPVVQQLQFSLNYVAQRHDVHVDRVLLMGLPSGAEFWSAFAKDTIGVGFAVPNVFDGLVWSVKGTAAMADAMSQQFMVALGAARAAMGGVA